MTRRIALLTGADRRHRYLAAELHRAVGLAAVVAEAKAAPMQEHLLPADEREVVRRHFAERDEVEARLLGEASLPADVPLLAVPQGGVNAAEALAWIRAAAPDLIVLYGTSLVQAPLLDAWSGRIVNLHLGLSPYYRGTASNFWALAHREPECVGATLHLATARVDAGGILEQVRPPCAAGDRAHELGTKALVAAAEALPATIDAYAAGRLVPVAQDLSHGRVFRRRDFTAAAVRGLWRQLETGMIEEYLLSRERRLARRPIVQQVAAAATDRAHADTY